MAYTGSVAWTPITVVEVEPFPTRAKQFWSDEERLEFISYLAWNPRAGNTIPGTGGLRKVRWSRQGTGRRGGVRVGYCFYGPSVPWFLLTVHAKTRTAILTRSQLKVLRRLAEHLKELYEQKR
jgi:hypothetical protein